MTSLLHPVPGLFHVRTLNLIAGASGAGKSGLIASWIRAMLDGEPVLGLPTHRPPAFFWLSFDRSWEATKYWFDAYGLPECPHYSFVDDKERDMAKFMKMPAYEYAQEMLGKVIAPWGLPPGSLGVIDPIPFCIGPDMNSYMRVAAGMVNLARIITAPDHQFCILGSDHPAKQSADKSRQYLRWEDKIGGSASKGAYSFTQMYLAEPAELDDTIKHHVLYWRPRQAPKGQMALQQDQTTGKLHSIALAPGGELPIPIPDTHLALYNGIPSDPPISMHQLKQLFCHGDFNLSVRTVEYHVDWLLTQRYIRRVGHGFYCRNTP